MSDLEVIVRVFLLIGSTFIAPYLTPVTSGRIDDWKKQEDITIYTTKFNRTRQIDVLTFRYVELFNIKESK